MEDLDVGKEPGAINDVIKLRTGMKGKGHMLELRFVGIFKKKQFMPVKILDNCVKYD